MKSTTGLSAPTRAPTEDMGDRSQYSEFSEASGFTDDEGANVGEESAFVGGNNNNNNNFNNNNVFIDDIELQEDSIQNSGFVGSCSSQDSSVFIEESVYSDQEDVELDEFDHNSSTSGGNNSNVTCGSQPLFIEENVNETDKFVDEDGLINENTHNEQNGNYVIAKPTYRSNHIRNCNSVEVYSGGAPYTTPPGSFMSERGDFMLNGRQIASSIESSDEEDHYSRNNENDQNFYYQDNDNTTHQERYTDQTSSNTNSCRQRSYSNPKSFGNHDCFEQRGRFMEGNSIVSNEASAGEAESFFKDEDTLSVESNRNRSTKRATIFGMPMKQCARIILSIIIAIVSGIALQQMIIRLKRASVANHDTNGKPILRFRAIDNTWKFKILQLADLHIGEAEFTDWGPEDDRKTWHVIDRVLRAEQPDLIVLSGDQLTANDIRENATKYYQEMGERLSTYNIPWAMIFGNHDDADFVFPGTNLTAPAKYKREDLLEIDQSFRLSLTQRGPSSLFGITNYILDIFVQDTAAAQIYFYDSGGGSIPEQLLQNQVNWFYESMQRLPAVAFQHIPTLEFRHSDGCMGMDEENAMFLKMDPGIVNAMSESTRVYFLAAGHNHGNDYCCPFSDWLQVCYGRRSGYGGYGNWDRGARVYELQIDDLSTYTLKWKSWVRMESGDVIDEVSMYDMMG